MAEKPKLALRVLAFLLDYLVILILIAISVGIGMLLQLGPLRHVGETLTASPLGGQLIGFVGLTLPVIVYFAITEASSRQATWGKRRMGLQVVASRTGARLTFGQSLARSALKFLPWELSHTLLWRIEGWPLNPSDPGPIIMAGFAFVGLLGLGYVISIAGSRTGQGLYDRMTGSRIVAVAAMQQPADGGM